LCDQVFLVASVIAAKHDVLARYRGQVIADVKEVANIVNEPIIALLFRDVLSNNHHSIRFIAGVGLVVELGHFLMQ
jgi:hypothetical protein